MSATIRVFNRADTALVYWGVTPCVVDELRSRNASRFYAAFLEFFVALVRSDQFGQAKRN